MFLQARGLVQARAAAATSPATAAGCVVHPCQLLRTVAAESACSLASCSNSGVHWFCSSVASNSSGQHQSWRCCSSVSSDATVSQEAAAAAAAAVPKQAGAAAAQEWSVLNFYHLVDIADPEEVCRPAYHPKTPARQRYL
jgi:hypothetical protein